jgi:hypothetical protein
MTSTEKLISQRLWIQFVDDERDLGNSLIVTLRDGWRFKDGEREGVRGFDTMAELKADTRKANVEQF